MYWYWLYFGDMAYTLFSVINVWITIFLGQKPKNQRLIQGENLFFFGDYHFFGAKTKKLETDQKRQYFLANILVIG